MATITKRKNKYLARVRSKGVERSKTFRTITEARAWAAQLEVDIANKRLGIAPKHLTVSDIVIRYQKEVTPLKRGHRSEHLRLSRLLRHELCNVLLTDVAPEHIADWRDDRLKQVQPPSVARELSTLSSVFNHAMREWRLINDNPCRKISRPKDNPERTRRPSDDEIRRLCAYFEFDDDVKPVMTKQRVMLAFLLAIETAMRGGEFCNIKWGDVDFGRRVVHLPMTKNGHSRDVPLSRRAIELLKMLEPLKLDFALGLSPEPLSTLFRRGVRYCEIDDLHFHDSRREALTRLSKKVDVMDLAKISGHRDIKILLNTYYAPDIANLADLLD